MSTEDSNLWGRGRATSPPPLFTIDNEATNQQEGDVTMATAMPGGMPRTPQPQPDNRWVSGVNSQGIHYQQTGESAINSARTNPLSRPSHQSVTQSEVPPNDPTIQAPRPIPAGVALPPHRPRLNQSPPAPIPFPQLRASSIMAPQPQPPNEQPPVYNDPWVRMENWLHRTFNELGEYIDQSFVSLHTKLDENSREQNQRIDRLVEVLVGFRVVVDAVRDNTVALGDRVTNVGGILHDLSTRTNSLRKNINSLDAQIILHGNDLCSIQTAINTQREELQEVQQSFGTIATNLNNLHDEILQDVRKPPSDKSGEDQGFSLTDKPTSTPKVPRTPSGFPMTQSYADLLSLQEGMEESKPLTKGKKRVSIVPPVPEGDTTFRPNLLDDNEENDEETIQVMEEQFRKSQIEDDKNKVKIPQPEYSGKHGTDANGWVVAMDNYIRYYPSKFPDDRQKIIVALTFLQKTKETKLWVTPILTKVLAREHHLLTRSWEAFKEGFINNFGDLSAHDNAFHKLKNLKQITSVAEYAMRFRTIAGDLNNPSEEMLLLFFLDGLKDAIREKIQWYKRADQRPRSLEQWIAQAIQEDNWEQQSKRTYGGGQRRATQNTTPGGTTTTPTVKKMLTDTEYARRREGNLCIKCGKGPHKARDCKGGWIGLFKEEGTTKGKVATLVEVTEEMATTESEN